MSRVGDAGVWRREEMAAYFYRIGEAQEVRRDEEGGTEGGCMLLCGAQLARK